MLLHQSNGTLTHFRRKFVVLAHGSIFSKVGASSKLGAIQPAKQVGGKADGTHRGRIMTFLFTMQLVTVFDGKTALRNLPPNSKLDKASDRDGMYVPGCRKERTDEHVPARHGRRARAACTPFGLGKSR